VKKMAAAATIPTAAVKTGEGNGSRTRPVAPSLICETTTWKRMVIPVNSHEEDREGPTVLHRSLPMANVRAQLALALVGDVGPATAALIVAGKAILQKAGTTARIPRMSVPEIFDVMLVMGQVNCSRKGIDVGDVQDVDGSNDIEDSWPFASLELSSCFPFFSCLSTLVDKTLV
jgi:hypothetical protein